MDPAAEAALAAVQVPVAAVVLAEVPVPTVAQVPEAVRAPGLTLAPALVLVPVAVSVLEALVPDLLQVRLVEATILVSATVPVRLRLAQIKASFSVMANPVL